MLKKTVKTFINTLAAPTTVVVGYSGGVDSHVLLHALASIKKDCPELHLSAVHVNHQLQSDAKVWESHCQKICDELQVPVKIIKVNAKKSEGESPEAAAREARYQAFSASLNKNNYLMTAHHQDDQAETVLLQLLRGAGLKGLSAMPAIMPFSQGFLARPLLSVSQKIILKYAEVNQLTWIDDETNADVAFQRNFLRHKVMPLLTKIRPAAVQAMSRSAKHCATASDLLEELAQEDLKKIMLDEKHLSAAQLKNLSMTRQGNVMRYWLQQQGCILPTTIKLQHILQDLIASRYDAKPELTWGGARLLRVKDKIFLGDVLA